MTQQTTLILLAIPYLTTSFLFLLFWRQKRRVDQLKLEIEELDILTEQNNEIINELIEDQEAMEEPLQKALVMSQFVIEKLGEMENVSFGPVIEKKKKIESN